MNIEHKAIELTIVENEKFRKLCDLYDQPDFVRKTFVKFMGEYCHVMKLKPKWLNPKFAEAIRGVRHPFGWRLKILMSWRKTVLKKHLHHEKQKDSTFRAFGRSVGGMENLNYTNEKLYCPQEEEIMKAAFAPFEDIPEETKNLIQTELDKADQIVERALQLIFALPPQQQSEFWIGYSEGQRGPFTEKLGFVDAEDNTKIYHLLLMLGDLIREFDTVEELYEFLKQRLKHEMPHSLETFKRICNYLGIRGANYLASMRRKKSIEGKKPVLPLLN